MIFWILGKVNSPHGKKRGKDDGGKTK